jgi:hypothetical protein
VLSGWSASANLTRRSPKMGIGRGEFLHNRSRSVGLPGVGGPHETPPGLD